MSYTQGTEEIVLVQRDWAAPTADLAASDGALDTSDAVLLDYLAPRPLTVTQICIALKERTSDPGQ